MRRAVDYEIGAELRDSVMIRRFLFADSGRIARIISGVHRAGAVTRLILDYAIDANWSAVARFNNVFDKRYELARDFGVPGANVFVALRYQPAR